MPARPRSLVGRPQATMTLHRSPRPTSTVPPPPTPARNDLGAKPDPPARPPAFSFPRLDPTRAHDLKSCFFPARQTQNIWLSAQPGFERMANPTATLTSLLRGATIEDHEEVLKAANAVLRTSKGNPDALHTRVVALLKLDRFDDALRALDDGGDALADRCVLEKAYALYKTGQLAEAQALVQHADRRGLKHVAAQVAYRAERFEDAARMYRELSLQPTAIEGEDNDLRINSSAVDAQLEWQGNGDKIEPSRKKPSREDLEAFETSYNAACGCVARGDLGPGSVLLKRARDLCEALDELSDEEKRAEVLPIMVQQAYVLSKLGKTEEAEALQETISAAEYDETPFSVVAFSLIFSQRS